MKVNAPSALAGPHLLADEERDIGDFRMYLTTLHPDALWDVLSHIDAEQYPRRHEAALREVKRRQIFFVDPYNDRDHRFRSFFGWTAFFAVLSLFLFYVGRVVIEIPPGLRLPFFTDLAVGGPKAARLLLPILVPLTVVCSVATLGMTMQGLWLLRKRRIPADLVGLGLLSALVAALCLSVVLAR